MQSFSFIQPAPPIRGMGIALDLLHTKTPFSNWNAKELISTVKGAARRGHYIILKDGDTFGAVACWGRCTKEIGEAYVAGQRTPTFQDCQQGDHLIMFILQADKPEYLKAITRFVKDLHPGAIAYGRRYHAHRPKLTSRALKIR
ncbi:hypothetical protein [Sneathiella chinensis]|uniref:Uncharacterized protein n=1 Tax=Sneathiella chinensis TaxID=349750 RepID=A0ABQ5U2M2_9PROT|nr:hypothetical protein [Sneathiella chinensis]GLQ05592.1 hypothetical protein GCM10007924_08130 [Sneathiella chinensis]